MRANDRQWTRCLDAEGQRATIERGRGIRGGVRPQAETGGTRARHRRFVLHRDDGVERAFRGRRTVRGREGCRVVVMTTARRQLREMRAGRGGVMTRRRTGDDVPVRLARVGASVEDHRQRRDSQSEERRDRQSCRPEHLSIVPSLLVRLSNRHRRCERATCGNRSAIGTAPCSMADSACARAGAILGAC
jgi:hypothetical protein